jgi:hypothetical protein
MQVRAAEKIVAKPEKVFNFIANPEQLLKNFSWAKDFSQSITNPNQYTFKIDGEKVKSVAEYTIDKVSKNRLLSFSLVSNQIESTNTFQIFPDQDGTILCVSSTLKFKGLLLFFNDFFPRRFNESAKAHLFHLKLELEKKKVIDSHR